MGKSSLLIGQIATSTDRVAPKVAPANADPALACREIHRLPSTQWRAVTTHEGAIKVPPQNSGSDLFGSRRVKTHVLRK